VTPATALDDVMPSFPLVFHSSLDSIIAWCDGAPVTVREFLTDAAQLAAALPMGGHVFNACKDRYRFAVGLAAALLRDKVSLLPSSHTPNTIRQLASFAPDAFCLHDIDECTVELPRFRFQDLSHAQRRTGEPDRVTDVPMIDASRVMAYVFTSGSTGTPLPHRKTWGMLVKGVRAAALRLNLLDASGTTLVATVPPQHMYGLESSVLLALIGGLALTNRQPFYPLDIAAALAAVPAPTVLVTSPIHLRALIASDSTMPSVSLILSATAPLSDSLAAQTEARLRAPLVEIYGSTETGQIATRRTAQSSIWHLLPGVTLQARQSAHDTEDEGEIWASGALVEEPVPMGDAIELVDDSHFVLHGRKSDLINIAGKRTSLAHLNVQLCSIPGVEDGTFFMPGTPCRSNAALEDVTRLIALVVAPALSPRDVQRGLRERIDAAFLPRPLLFVDALPRNAAGKLPRELLAALVAKRMGDATDVSGSLSRTTSPITFEIAADHPASPDHFPGRPIVPGVVLLDHAIHIIASALGRSLDALTISSAKFPGPATFGVPLELSFHTNENGAIHFQVSATARTVASGVLKLERKTR
jgi:acyl-coenzyme A synthetase/AMP-(fatty) acid ligase